MPIASTELLHHRLFEASGVSVEYRRVDFRDSPPHKLHAHDTLQIAWITAGGSRFRIGNREMDRTAGSVVVFPPGVPHSCHVGERSSFSIVSLEFHPKSLPELAVARCFDDECDTIPLGNAVRLLSEAIESADGEDEDTEERFLVLIDVLDRTFVLPEGHASQTRITSRERKAVAKVRALLVERAMEPLPLDELARESGLSPFRLVRAFGAEFGLPPHAFQIQQRLILAREMIRSGLPLATAAVRAGFSDQSHLNRCFRETLLMTPGQYARLFRTP